MATTLGRKSKDVFSSLSLLLLSATFVFMSTNVRGENVASQATVQTAATSGEHNVLAKHFEDAAHEMQIKADQQKELFEQYENRHLYGWQAHNLKSQASALIRKYEQAARSSMREADYHRRMAQEFKNDRTIHGSLGSDSVFKETLRVEKN